MAFILKAYEVKAFGFAPLSDGKVAGKWEHSCPDCVAPSRRKGTLL